MKTTLRRTAVAALLAIAALALPAAAQDAQAAPAARPEAPKQDKPAAQRPPAGTQDAGQAQRPDAAQQPAGAMPKDEMMKRLATEEAKHRGTVARIDRLRELAQQRGQSERLTELGDLLKKENDRYASYRTKARAAMGDDSFKATERRLAQGRGRGAQQKQDAAQPARKPDQQQRPAPSGQQRPPAPKANNDAKPAAPADRPKANNKRQAQANTGARKPAAGGQRGSNPR